MSDEQHEAVGKVASIVDPTDPYELRLPTASLFDQKQYALAGLVLVSKSSVSNV